MAEKKLKCGKRKVVPSHEVKEESRKVVLVGTYATGQLEAWPGYYPYPLYGDDKIDVEAYKKVNEIWLFRGVQRARYFAAECLGVKTRGGLKALGYPLKGTGHGNGTYLLFKIVETYAPANTSVALAAAVECVLVRTKDFARRSPKVAKQLKQYLESPDRDDPELMNQLPTVITKLPPEKLCVRETAIQMEFIQIIRPEWRFPSVGSLVYRQNAIRRCPQTEIACPQTPNGMPFRLGEFFCGPGGLACGAISATIENPSFKIEHAWSSDYDKQTCNTYKENICHDCPETVICHDVRTLPLDDARLTPIDGFAFGFPCNDFSVVGEHRGIDGNYGPLYQYGVAVLEKFKPLWFVAENVGGLASANEGAAFKRILQSLKGAGYRIYPHLYKFEDYGVPQSRHRIIIVGVREDLPFVFFPPSPHALEPQDNSSRSAIENPPIPVTAPNNERTTMNPRVVERLCYIKPGQNAFTANLPERLQLHVKGATISQIYKRLDPDKPAYTVTGSGGGGTHIYHYSEPRALTNRERARLQTFPDRYIFTGNKESVRRQIGMAVPPRGARIIFEALLRMFAGIEYLHVSCNITDEGEFCKGGL